MKKIFIITAFVGIIAWYWSAANTNKQETQIMGTQHDSTRETKFVPDSVFLNNQAIIDSLTTVTELLDHLETLPSNEELSN
jgi:hypothetical protein